MCIKEIIFKNSGFLKIEKINKNKKNGFKKKIQRTVIINNNDITEGFACFILVRENTKGYFDIFQMSTIIIILIINK